MAAQKREWPFYQHDEEARKLLRLQTPDDQERNPASLGHVDGGGMSCAADSLQLPSAPLHAFVPNALQCSDLKAGIEGPPHSHRYSNFTATNLSSSQSPSDEDSRTCCYGMLYEVKAQLFQDAAVLEDASFQPTSSIFPLKLIYKRNYVLQDYNGLELAVLHHRTSDGFRSLDQLGNISYEVYVLTEIWKEAVQYAKNAMANGGMDVEVNVSGPYSQRQTVGCCLSKAGLCLQHPRFLPDGMQYHNPHFIVFPERKDRLPEFTVSPMTIQSEYKNPEEANYNNISSVFDGLNHQEHLNAINIDETIITTKLQKHQKEAVDFIALREAPHTHPEFSLWNSDTSNKNRSCYQHAVLGIRKHQPPRENVGGILADEMGLGKSLTMLSSLLISLENAKQFADGLSMEYRQDGQKPATKATLVIVPSVLILLGWIREITEHFKPAALKYLSYHGHGRSNDISTFLDNDVVFTTYATISYEYSGGTSALHKVEWYRVVLDEAHMICRQRTNRFRAVTALAAQHRWCLTGTPIQNGLGDLAALVRFLKVPYMDNAFIFQSHISSPVEQGDTKGLSRLKALLKGICLRRTVNLLQLPETIMRTHRIELSTSEQIEYRNIAAVSRRAIDDAVSGNSTAQAYQGLCQAILQLRLFCNHGISSSTSQSLDEQFSFLQQSGQATCAHCSQGIDSIDDVEGSRSGILAECSHLLCSGCVSQGELSPNGSGARESVLCPVCEKVTGLINTLRDEGQGPTSPPSKISYSSKFWALLQDILEHQNAEKSIVFSSWKKTIFILSSLLTSYGIFHGVVEGSMSISERKQELLRFQQDPNRSILLMTLGTGSAGLNLTMASRIHLVEPQWNPSVEQQAIGRAVRIGQQKEVTVVRYIMRNTVEEYIQTRQAKKKHLASLGWDNDHNDSTEGKLEHLMEIQRELEKL